MEINFEYVFKKNRKEKASAYCKFKDERRCGWYRTASACSSTSWFYIKEFDRVHTCGHIMFLDRGVKRLSSKCIARLIIDSVRDNDKMNPVGIVQHFHNCYGLDISYKKVWLAFEKAKSLMYRFSGVIRHSQALCRHGVEHQPRQPHYTQRE
ncbi:hypothetical protein Droror1_Dr00013697 [Drosera rotundifolia]